MKEECLICRAPLEYLETDVLMECEICHKKEYSKTRCVNGHYVCNDCHTRGLDSIIGLCMKETSKDPIAIIEKMMAMPFCHMHGPEHHVMVGSALLTAYKNAGGDLDLHSALIEMMNRGKSVPGGACGFWGACGAGISSGMFISIISKSTPLANEPFALSHKMTAKSLGQIGEIGGPRCCKRASFLSILVAVDFVKDHFGVEVEKPEVVCHFSGQNNQCIGKRCPFSKAKGKNMVGKYKVITLCGSTRFKDAFMEAQKRLTLEGNIVISVGLFGHSGDDEVWTEGTKEMLDDMHKRKIDMADEIFVINVGGYIGSSTRSEIEYAIAAGKAVRYLEV